MDLRLLLLCFAAVPAGADTKVWLIGGGNTLDNSQAQIEANVRWLEDLLSGAGVGVRTYFGRGHEPGPDVAYWAPEAQPDHEQAFARIFGESREIGVQYRRHEVRALAGGTAKPELVAALARDFSSLSPSDDVLLVYNGHGGLERADTRENYLKLWGDERLTVRETEALLDAAPRGVPVRFVMTQCYSGAFHSLVYDDPRSQEGFRGDRCGFMAESDTRLAEGCELTADQREYRDYTTYFFAALNGATRLGQPLPAGEVDRNGDGAVSFREAHFHALVTAHSADLSRSTSEQFLENWAPWYLRWDSLRDNEDSVYWQLADEIASRYGWQAQPAALEPVRREYARAASRYEAERTAARQRVMALREELGAALLAKYPQLASAGSPSPGALAEIWPQLRGELAADARYEELRRQQRALRSLGGESLERSRSLTQIEKIYRLRRLARLEHALRIHGDDEVQEQYSQLLQCEAGTLQPNGAAPGS
jgi:hypothetical protein